MRALSLFAILLMAVLLSNSGPAQAEPKDTRPPEALERAYVGLALDFESHEICKRISPKAMERNAGNTPGRQIYFTRSECFFFLALRTLNPFLCGEVVQAKAFMMNGRGFTQKQCEQEVNELARGNRRFEADITFDHQGVLRAAGYTDAHVKAVIKDHPTQTSWMDFYHYQIKNNGGAFQQRMMKSLPDFSKR